MPFKRFFSVLLVMVFLVHPTTGWAAEEEKPDDPCVGAMAERFTEIDEKWLESLNALTKQQKPTSNLVEVAIANYRTYVCELDAVCEDVRKSTDSNKKAENHNMIGCFRDKPHPVQRMAECDSAGKALLSAPAKRNEYCIRKIAEKKETEKVFMQTTVMQDAQRKKTGFLFMRYEILLRRVHDELAEHVRLMVGAFARFADSLNCLVKQCD